MKRYSWLSLILALGFLGLRLFAQEATEEAAQGWPVVERCVGEPTIPPADWSFEGTILATGWAGIHGINVEWETPRVLAFRVPPRRSNWEVYGASISEDGHWYSELHWEAINSSSPYGGIHLEELVVFSLLNSGETYRVQFPWEDRYVWDASYGRSAGAVIPFWWDETHVLVINDLVNPFISEIVQAPVHEYPNDNTISPDRSREIQRQYFYDSFPYNFYSYENGERESLFYWDDAVLEVAWKHDSSEVVVRLRDSGLNLFNRNSEFIDKIINATRLGDFSYDDRYLSLSINGYLHFADMEEHIIYNTCLEQNWPYTPSYRRMIWSSQANQGALMALGEGQRSVLVFDLDNWHIYETGIYHDGDIIFWRAD
jgi:hypothetical protein